MWVYEYVFAVSPHVGARRGVCECVGGIPCFGGRGRLCMYAFAAFPVFWGEETGLCMRLWLPLWRGNGRLWVHVYVFLDVCPVAFPTVGEEDPCV